MIKYNNTKVKDSYLDTIYKIKGLKMIEYKRPIPKNEGQKVLLQKLEKMNIFFEIVDIFESLEDKYIPQSEFYRHILKHFADKQDLKGVYDFEIIKTFILNNPQTLIHDTDFFENEEFIKGFFLHRFLYRNLKGLYMQEIIKIAILESLKDTDKFQKIELLENNKVDTFFAIDYVAKVTFKEDLVLYAYLHVTKNNFTGESQIATKLAQQTYYKKITDSGCERIYFPKFHEAYNLEIKYKNDYTYDNVPVIYYTDNCNLPINPIHLVPQFYYMFAQPHILKKMDLEYNQVKSSKYETAIIPTLEKTGDEELITITTI